MLNKIMLPADADAQCARLTSAGTALTGHLAVTGSAGAGLVVRIRPWLTTPGRYAASISFTQARAVFTQARAVFTQARAVFTQARAVSDLSAQPSAAKTSTAAASGLCTSKQYQEKARSAAAIGGALGPLPPRDPV